MSVFAGLAAGSGGSGGGYVVGSYTGSGNPVTVELGFRPSFVIISGRTESTSTGSTALSRYEAFSAGNILKNQLEFTDTGFIAKSKDNYYPDLDHHMVYDYIAFK